MHTLSNYDYFIARRAFFFDLSPWADEPPNDDPRQPPGTDHKALLDVLMALYKNADGGITKIGGFPPWPFKATTPSSPAGKHEGVPTEWEFSRLISQFNAYKEADAAGLGAMANASFFQHFPRQAKYTQPNPIPTARSVTPSTGGRGNESVIPCACTTPSVSRGAWSRSRAIRWRPSAALPRARNWRCPRLLSLPWLPGLLPLRQASGRCHVVFVTEYDEYALAAFDAGAVDYVMKPVEATRLAQALERVRSRLQPVAGTESAAPAGLQAVLEQLAGQLRRPPPLDTIQAGVGKEVRLIRVADGKYPLGIRGIL